MIITAPTWRALVRKVEELGHAKTKARLKRSGGMWVWRQL